LEQAIINLVRNAAEATLPATDAIVIACAFRADRLHIDVVDAGCGLAAVDNLFVPFFSTKPTGAGVGLVLARQIVEAHGGRLRLRNRDDATGCVAQIEIPA
ncbi:MAG TPA: ATP-binding protein, partial [Tahibacter sp.]|nr:ATP-binding protein [Tahibacter sp.]